MGFSVVDFARDVLGVELMPWQRWLMIHALELRPDGRFRFRTVLVLVGRQNGKTTVVEIKNLWKMFILKVPLVIGTAQNLDISEESWDKAVEIVESVPELASEIARVEKSNGKKALKLIHGSRWKAVVASRKARGLSGDDVNLDELREHQTWQAWGAVTKTTMARANAQVWAYSNAGDDKSVVLNDLQVKGRAAAEQLVSLLAKAVVAEAEAIARNAAEQGIDTSLGLFEWSAPDDVRCTCGQGQEEGQTHTPDCRLWDRSAWAQANPALGYGITEEAIASALSTDPEPIFRTEVLCQRVPSLAPDWQVIPETLWRDLVVTGEKLADQAFAVVVNHERTHSCIASVGTRVDGRLQAFIVDYREGTHWVVERVAKLAGKYRPVAVAIQDKGPSGTLIDDLEKAGVRKPADPDRPTRGCLAVPWAAEVAIAYGLTIDALVESRLTHVDDAVLNEAARTAGTRPLSGGTAWDYRGDPDPSPMIAATLAHWAYVTRIDLVTQEYDAMSNIF